MNNSIISSILDDFFNQTGNTWIEENVLTAFLNKKRIRYRKRKFISE